MENALHRMKVFLYPYRIDRVSRHIREIGKCRVMKTFLKKNAAMLPVAEIIKIMVEH